MPGTRTFYFACCIISAAVLVIVFVGALPARSVPPEVASGLTVWRVMGCENCHTLYGQGGSYAPDLTHIYSQRGPDYIREFLVNPNAFHPNQRAMPRFLLTRTETDHLLAFLAWAGQQTAWPPRAVLVAGVGSVGLSGDAVSGGNITSDDPVERGRALFSRAPANCATCHLLEPDAVRIGPSLAGIATRAATRIPGMSAEEYIRNSIISPGDYIVEGFPDAMQKNLGDVLTSQQINDLIAFLMTLSA